MSTASEDAKVSSMMAGVIQGNVVYRFRTDTASVRPFVFGGAGPALLSARSVGDEVNAWTAGAGQPGFPGSSCRGSGSSPRALRAHCRARGRARQMRSVRLLSEHAHILRHGNRNGIPLLTNSPINVALIADVAVAVPGRRAPSMRTTSSRNTVRTVGRIPAGRHYRSGTHRREQEPPKG